MASLIGDVTMPYEEMLASVPLFSRLEQDDLNRFFVAVIEAGIKRIAK